MALIDQHLTVPVAEILEVAEAFASEVVAETWTRKAACAALIRWSGADRDLLETAARIAYAQRSIVASELLTESAAQLDTSTHRLAS